MNIPLIILFLFIVPIISFFAILLTNKERSIDENQLMLNIRYTSIWTFFLIVLLCFLLFLFFDFNAYLFQFVESKFSILKLNYKFGIDGISLVFLLLNSILLLAFSFVLRMDSFSSCKNIFIIFLMMQFASIALFSSLNLLFFVLSFEIISINLYLMLSKDCKKISADDLWRIIASLSFANSIFFIASSYIYFKTGTANIDDLILYEFSPNEEMLLCYSMLFSLLIKIGILPFGRSWIYFCTNRSLSFIYLIIINCYIYVICRICISLFSGVIYGIINYVSFALLSFAILNNLVINSDNLYKASFSHIPIILLSILLGKDGVIGAIFYLIGYNVIHSANTIFLTSEDRELRLASNSFFQNFILILLLSISSGFMLSSYLVGYLIILQSLFELSGVLFSLGMFLWVLLFVDNVLVYPKIIKKNLCYDEMLILSLMLLIIVGIGLFPNIVTDLLSYSFFID